MRDQERWADIRNAFSDFSLEDLYTLRKAVELRKIHTYWDQTGLIAIGHLELLAKEFSYDQTLQKIYKHMFNRVNERMKDRFDQGLDLTNDDYEYMFCNQPFVYNDNVTEKDIRTVIYDYNKCMYKKRLQTKYSKLYDVIEDMVMW